MLTSDLALSVVQTLIMQNELPDSPAASSDTPPQPLDTSELAISAMRELEETKEQAAVTSFQDEPLPLFIQQRFTRLFPLLGTPAEARASDLMIEASDIAQRFHEDRPTCYLQVLLFWQKHDAEVARMLRANSEAQSGTNGGWNRQLGRRKKKR